MHEMGIVNGILEASLAAAARENATRINEIRIRVGVLTEVVDDALQFAFAALAAETIAQEGRLAVEHVPATSRCLECRIEFEHGRFDIACPRCGNMFCESVTGRELEIDSIDISLPGDAPDGMSGGVAGPGTGFGPASGGGGMPS